MCKKEKIEAFHFTTMIFFRGNPSNSKRYKILVGCSYGLPLIVTILTLIVEFGAPQCASYRPRFGEESCFFSGYLHSSYVCSNTHKNSTPTRRHVKSIIFVQKKRQKVSGFSFRWELLFWLMGQYLVQSCTRFTRFMEICNSFN